MPNLDGAGPVGGGAGRGLGTCGRPRRIRGGMGRFFPWCQTGGNYTKDSLQQYIDMLKQEIERVEKMLKNMSTAD